MPRDSVIVRSLRVYAFHGVLESEQAEGQEFLIDIEVETDLGPAADSDDLSRTIDYAELAASAARIATEERYDLIETLACRLADHALGYRGALAATVTVIKPDAPLTIEAGWVGVTVRRDRAGSGER